MSLAETKTTCPYCGVGCGVIAMRSPEGAVTVKGDPGHPANFGRLCSKGAALAETVDLDGRLLVPMINGEAVSWDAALDRVAQDFKRIIRDHGPDSVAFYVSGQLLTEDYYVINKLAKGFVGTANIDTNSRLCMASSVAGHKRAFGSDTVPGNYQDLEEADLVVFTGSNAAWCHPVLHQRILAARERKPAMRMVVIDPRRTDSCQGADLHLPLKSGSDAVLFNGLLAHLATQEAADAEFVAAHTNGFPAALAAAAALSVADVARGCGLPAGDVQRFYDWFAATPRTVTLYSQGVNQSSSGADKVNAIINCHLLTGRIGRPGMGPFSLTGQPNAMGGREVGGLANMLAAHMEIDNPAHRDLVQGFWASPAMAQKAGRKAVDMFDAMASGQIKAVWIMSTNPLVSLPDADAARAALAKCQLVVVSDVLRHTDTTRAAHVLLPATAWGEKAGTVTNSERRISRQRPFLPAPGQARPDWRQVCDIARRMGFAKGFNFMSAADIFREHAALSGHKNNGTRDFDISAFANVSDEEFEALAPVQWPAKDSDRSGTERLFSQGGFFTEDRRARFIPVTPRGPKNAPDCDYPLLLNTARVRDHWHTMTRTGKSARLSSHVFEPFVSINQIDASAASVADGDIAHLKSRWGAMLARVRISADQSPGAVAAPMHWTGEFAAKSRVNSLVNPEVDPVSGQPELKHTPVRLERLATAWQAFALSREDIAAPPAEHWVRGKAVEHWRLEMAGTQDIGTAEDLARSILQAHLPRTEWLAYRDGRARIFRYAAVRDNRLEGCLFAGPGPVAVSRQWLGGLFSLQISARSRPPRPAFGPPASGIAGPGSDRLLVFWRGREPNCFGHPRPESQQRRRNWPGAECGVQLRVVQAGTGEVAGTGNGIGLTRQVVALSRSPICSAGGLPFRPWKANKIMDFWLDIAAFALKALLIAGAIGALAAVVLRAGRGGERERT